MGGSGVKEVRALEKVGFWRDRMELGRDGYGIDKTPERWRRKSHSRRFGELLQTDNGHIDGGARPGVVRDNLAADTVEHRE